MFRQSTTEAGDLRSRLSDEIIADENICRLVTRSLTVSLRSDQTNRDTPARFCSRMHIDPETTASMLTPAPQLTYVQAHASNKKRN